MRDGEKFFRGCAAPLPALSVSLLLVACGGGGDRGDDSNTRLPDPQPGGHIVQPGSYFRTSFPVEAGKSYQLQLNQRNCATSGDPADNNACCALMISDPGADAPTWENGWHDMVAGPSSTQWLPFDPATSGALNVAVYGVHPQKSCEFEEPVISEAVGTEGSLYFLTGSGQAGGNYQLASTSMDGNNYFLRDISRRSNMASAAGNLNTGQLFNWATLTTQRISGIHQAQEFPLVEYQVGDSFWGGRNTDLVDAHVGTALVYDFWFKRLDINSYDGKGSPMFAFQDLPYPWVEAQFCGRSVPPNTLYNAFYMGGAIYYSTYGEKLTPYIYSPTDRPPLSFSAALDVTAHEWAHGLTDRFSRLEYERESGALNEAFSDWMGVAVEWYRDGALDWEVGEDTGEALRDLSDPTRFGDPDTYMGEFWADADESSCPEPDVCVNDFCGVHRNSGVPNKMFHLLAAGGEHNGVALDGVGIETAIKIAVDANRYQWSGRETFLSARSGMEAAAASYGDVAIQQVALAWRAVGVETEEEKVDSL